MPFYYRIDETTDDGRRTARNLLKLREKLQEIPARTISDTLLLATWNIREFDSAKYGPRLPESYYYIAEIISRFDIVAIQEVRQDLSALNRLKNILGDWWDYIVTDVTEGHQGNKERLAFLYDRRKIRFAGLASEVVMPPVKLDDKKYKPAEQLARTPFLCGFAAGWFKFNLCTVHILYGTQAAKDPNRLKEIQALSLFLRDKANAQLQNHENMIVLGDFNIFSQTDDTMKAITDAGFIIPRQLQSLPGSNVKKDKFYDQIAFMVKDRRLDLEGDSQDNNRSKKNAGVFDYYEAVYTAQEEETYLPVARANYKTHKGRNPNGSGYPGKGYSDWRTYQMSDHLPMWVELKIDFGKEYLESKSNGGRR